MADKPKVEGLNPEPPDEESKKIMEGIKKDKAKKAKQSPEQPEKPEEEAGKLGEILEKDPADLTDEEKETIKKKKDELTDEQKEKFKGVLKPEKPPDEEEEEEEEEVIQTRTPKLIPKFKHEIAKKKWAKILKDKEEEIADLKVEIEKKKKKPEREEAIKTFAEKHGMEVEMVKDLLALIGPPPKLPDEVKKDLETLKEDKEKQRQSKLFDEEYGKTIVPLLDKLEIAEDRRPRLKKLLEKLAFTTTYAADPTNPVPLIVIYKGVEEFRAFEVKGKKSAEPSRGGARGKEDEPVTGEDIMNMDDEAFEKWSNAKAKAEKKFKIVRKGEELD